MTSLGGFTRLLQVPFLTVLTTVMALHPLTSSAWMMCSEGEIVASALGYPQSLHCPIEGGMWSHGLLTAVLQLERALLIASPQDFLVNQEPLRIGCKVLARKSIGRRDNVAQWAGQQTRLQGRDAGRVPMLLGTTGGLSDSYLDPPPHTHTHSLPHTPTLPWQPVVGVL